jgi:hypothetical protein
MPEGLVREDMCPLLEHLVAICCSQVVDGLLRKV